MEMEIALCDMIPEEGAWDLAKWIRKTTTITGKDKVIRISAMVTEEYQDRQVFVTVDFRGKCVAAAHVDVNMLVAAAKSLKAFKDARLSEEE